MANFSTVKRLLSNLPPLGFGCCPMGGYGWGQVDSEELKMAVVTALELGVSVFDTSDIYGLGASEILLGQALQGRRSDAFIASKFGVRHKNGLTFYDTSPSWIVAAAEASLRRLNTDYIDLYQMHYWDKITPIDEIVLTLDSLCKSGKIRAYGVTNYDPRVIQGTSKELGLATYSYQYNLVQREQEELIMAIQKNSDLFFMSWGSLGQGILSGSYESLAQLPPGDRRRRDVYTNFHGTRFFDIKKIIHELKLIAEQNEIASVTQLALRWIVDRIPRALPLIGIKRPQQITDASRILHFKLTTETCRQLDLITQQFKIQSILV